MGWGPGANFFYDQSVANTRLVAKQLRLLLQRLMREAGLQLKDVHLIGHSLGAHISGDTGRQLGGQIGRITGRVYNTTLLPGVKGMFCGAKYTHHTFTPIIKH